MSTDRFNHLRYRVNYGQGQVEYPGSKRDCFRYIGAMSSADAIGVFVEWQDPDTGEWFHTGTNETRTA